MSQAGLSGTFQVSVSATGRMAVKLPFHLITAEIGAVGTLDVAAQPGGARLHGELTFWYDDDSGTVDVDVTV